MESEQATDREEYFSFPVQSGNRYPARKVQTKMSDRTLTCRDCGNEFVFTAGEQDFYTSRGFSEPQRCPSCRQQRKAQRNGGGDSFGHSGGFGNDSYSGGYTRSGGRDFGGNGGGQRTLYPATCSECGKETEVPFNPSPGKPVYCRECFQARRANSPRW